jgi:hypothetical protein
VSKSQNYPYLKHLLGCYFHQDYNIEGDTLEDVVGAFNRDCDYKLQKRADVINDIDKFLNDYKSNIKHACKLTGPYKV